MVKTLLADCMLLAICGLSVIHCAPSQPSPSRSDDLSLHPEQVPGSDLAIQDEIDSVDLAIDRNGFMHLAWREVHRRPDGTGLPEYQTFYSSRSAETTVWKDRSRLPFRAAPRLGLAADGVYLLAGPQLRAARKSVQGSWLTLGSKLPEPLTNLSSFDVATVGEDLLIAAIARERDDVLALYAFGLLDGPELRRIATFGRTSFDQPAPRLVADGSTLHLLWAVNVEERRHVEHGGRRSVAVSVLGRVLYSRSMDGGATWNEPTELTAGGADQPQGIDSVDLVLNGDRLIALYASSGLFSSRSSEGRRWSKPVRVSGITGSALQGGPGVRSLSAAGGSVVWIDDRYRESDRRWWKPLGAWPWSDSPDWVDNDLLLLTASELRTATGSRQIVPRRLTLDLTFVRAARLAASPSGLHVVWAGRHPVGEARDSFSAVPALYLERIGQADAR